MGVIRSCTILVVLTMVGAQSSTNSSASSNDSCRNVIYNVRTLQQFQTDTGCKNTSCAEIADLKSKLATLQEEVSTLKQQVSSEHGTGKRSPVGFHVLMTRTQTGRGPIIFDRIISNYGNWWNNVTYSFTAPIRGLYMFHLTILNVEGVDTRAEIRRGHHGIQLVYTSNGPDFDTGAGSTILELESGDVITAWLLVGQLQGNNNDYNHFTGALIHPV